MASEPTSKLCRDCGATLPLDQFPLQKGGRWGRHPLCKACRAAQESRRYERDREAILARAKADPKRKTRARWWALEKKYGLTKHEYELLYVARARLLCDLRDAHRAPAGRPRPHHGEVRGLLCDRCNFGVGNLADDAALCRVAAAHLLAQC